MKTLIIRKEQMAIFEAVALADFENRIINHVLKHFQDDCASIKEVELREIIQQRIEQAKGCGLESERDICTFINLIFAFGADFHKLPWARQVLEDKWIDTPSARMRQLSAKAQNQLTDNTT